MNPESNKFNKGPEVVKGKKIEFSLTDEELREVYSVKNEGGVNGGQSEKENNLDREVEIVATEIENTLGQVEAAAASGDVEEFKNAYIVLLQAEIKKTENSMKLNIEDFNKGLYKQRYGGDVNYHNEILDRQVKQSQEQIEKLGETIISVEEDPNLYMENMQFDEVRGKGLETVLLKYTNETLNRQKSIKEARDSGYDNAFNNNPLHKLMGAVEVTLKKDNLTDLEKERLMKVLNDVEDLPDELRQKISEVV